MASCISCPPGKYSTGDDCTACPVDTYQEYSGKSFCNTSTPGYIVGSGGSFQIEVPEGSRTCTDEETCDFKSCLAGTVGVDDRTECLPCKAGTTSFKGAMECIPCGKGKYAPEKKSKKCKECAINTYSDDTNTDKITCLPCPKGEAAEIGSGSCTPIPGRKQVTDCTLNGQYLDNTHIAPSNWTCQDCRSIKHGKGADCSGHRNWQDVTSRPGFRQMSYDNQYFGECLNKKACNNNGTSLKCTHGHDGELCSQCIPGWAALSRTEPCEECKKSSLGLVAFVFAILIALLVFSFLVWDNLDGARMMIPKEGDDEAKSTSMPFHSIAIRIVSSYLQVSGMLLRFDMSLPKEVEVLVTVESGASSLGERLLMFECLTEIRDDYSLFMARQLSMVWLIPLASVLLCMIFWFLLFRRKWSFDGFISSLMILFYTFFPSIVTRVALTSSCQKYGTKTLLTEALSVECWTEKHRAAILTVGLPGLILYVIVIPLLLAIKMIKQRRLQTLYHDQEKYDPKWTLRYGFVFAGYRSGYEWWESIIMLRKCCFVLLSIYLGVYGATPQVVAASMVLVVALSLQLQYLPFQNEDHNLLESIGLHACLLQLLVALMCNSVGKTDNNTLGKVSTIVLILVMFGSSVGFFWWTLRVTVQNSQDTEGAVGVFAHVFVCCCKRKEVPVSNVVPIRTNSDAHTIAALRMRASVQEALKIKAIKKATQIVPLKKRNKLAKMIEKSIRKSKVETIQNNHTASSNNRKKELAVEQTNASDRLKKRLTKRHREI